MLCPRAQRQQQIQPSRRSNPRTLALQVAHATTNPRHLTDLYEIRDSWDGARFIIGADRELHGRFLQSATNKVVRDLSEIMKEYTTN